MRWSEMGQNMMEKDGVTYVELDIRYLRAVFISYGKRIASIRGKICRKSSKRI